MIKKNNTSNNNNFFFHDHLSYVQFLHLFNIIKIGDLFLILWVLGRSNSENKPDKKYQTNKKTRETSLKFTNNR